MWKITQVHQIQRLRYSFKQHYKWNTKSEQNKENTTRNKAMKMFKC